MGRGDGVIAGGRVRWESSDPLPICQMVRSPAGHEHTDRGHLESNSETTTLTGLIVDSRSVSVENTISRNYTATVKQGDS